MTPLEILTKAREWLDDPAHWTQGAYCRDSAGFARFPVDHPETVVSTCAQGALMLAEPVVLAQGGSGPDDAELESYHAAGDFLRAAVWVVKAQGIPEWNDHAEHAEVLAAFDKAIAMARLEPTLDCGT